MTYHPPPASPPRDDLPDGISSADVIVAVDVSLEAYLSDYADARCEWVEGMVIQLSPAEIRHHPIDRFDPLPRTPEGVSMVTAIVGTGDKERP